MNINHLLLFFFLLMFVFIITYDPQKGTLHNGFVLGNSREKKIESKLSGTGPDYDDLRYGAPTRLMTDFMGAIFHS